MSASNIASANNDMLSTAFPFAVDLFGQIIKKIKPTSVSSQTVNDSAMASLKVPTPTLNCVPGTRRYPKRAREEVKYYDSDDSEEDEPVDSEGECEDEMNDICLPPFKRIKTTASSRPLHPKKIFPFMRLPAELRNKIYEECLASNDINDQGTPSLHFNQGTHAYRQIAVRCRGDEISRNSRVNGYGYSSYQHGHNASQTTSQAHVRPCCLKPLAPNILGVCKTIYQEAGSMLYNQCFVFGDPSALTNFMTEVSPMTAKLIKHIEIRHWGHSRGKKNSGFHAMAMLAAKGCTNLETLVVRGSIGYFGSYAWQNSSREQPVAKRIARQAYRSFYPWLEAVGMAKGDMFAGIDVITLEGTFKSTDHHNYSRPQAKDDTIESRIEDYRKALKILIQKGMGML